MKKTKKCFECKAPMKEMDGVMSDGLTHKYYRCTKCGDEVLDIKQLGALAKKYKELKKNRAKFTKWGLSIGVRIPGELVKKYNISTKKEAQFIPEKDGIKLLVV